MSRFDVACGLADLGFYSEAFVRFSELAEEGDTAAMVRLAAMYGAGEGTERNLQKSIYWDTNAINGGDKSAILNIGLTHKSIGDLDTARSFFQQALERGDGEGGIEILKIALKELAAGIDIPRKVAAIIQCDNTTEASLEELAVIVKWLK